MHVMCVNFAKRFYREVQCKDYLKDSIIWRKPTTYGYGLKEEDFHHNFQEQHAHILWSPSKSAGILLQWSFWIKQNINCKARALEPRQKRKTSSFHHWKTC